MPAVGNEINFRNGRLNETMLHLTTRDGHTSCMKVLLENNADPNLIGKLFLICTSVHTVLARNWHILLHQTSSYKGMTSKFVLEYGDGLEVNMVNSLACLRNSYLCI